MPGGPSTVTRRQCRSDKARSKAPCNIASSSRRPTSGASSRRSKAGAPSITRTSRYASTRSDFPLSESVSTASTSIAPRARRRVVSPIYLARLRRLLETRCDVDGVARRKSLVRAGDDLARIDAGAKRQRDAVGAVELVIQRRKRSAKVRGCAKGTQGIIFVHRRRTEDGHDSIPDELLDRAAMALEASSRHLEVARHHMAQRLGIELLAEHSRAGHIGEENGDRLPYLSGRRGRQRRATVVAEAGAVRVRPVAARTSGHRGSL